MVLELEEVLTILGDDFLGDNEAEELVEKLEVIAIHFIDKTMNEVISNEQ